MSNAQYAEFLAANVESQASNPRTSPPTCESNDTYTPSCEWPAAGNDDHPVVCVDLCDAAAYCEWAGKRLCADIPGTPADELGLACAGGWESVGGADYGKQPYPYGMDFDPEACNGLEHGADGTVPVGSLAACEGGYPGLFDLSGNVYEWDGTHFEDRGPDDGYKYIGGAWNTFGSTPDADMTCGSGSVTRLLTARDNLGFRCCADTVAGTVP